MNSGCIVCGREDLTSKIRGSDWNVMQCPSCGMGITDPNPLYGKKENIYDKDYFTDEQGIMGRDFADSFNEKIDRKRFSEILNKLKKMIPAGKVLDFGCATGTFLACAGESGWEIHGAEVSSYAADIAGKRLGIEIYTGDVFKSYDEEYFDLLTLHHALEHIRNPLELLVNISRILRKNGILFIEVPNFSSNEARVYKGQWEDLRPEQHIYHFSPQSMQLLIEQAGYELVKIETLSVSMWHSREALKYLDMAYRFISGSTSPSENTHKDNNVVDSGDSGRPRGYRRFANLVHYATWLLLRLFTWSEEKLNRGKRLLVYARKRS